MWSIARAFCKATTSVAKTIQYLDNCMLQLLKASSEVISVLFRFKSLKAGDDKSFSDTVSISSICFLSYGVNFKCEVLCVRRKQ